MAPDGGHSDEAAKGRGLTMGDMTLGDLADPLGLLIALFEHSPVAFQICSVAGRVVLVNQAFQDLFGSAPPPDYNLLEDEIAREQGVLDNIRRAFAGDTVHVGPFWYDPRDLRQVTVSGGRRVSIECTFFPLTGRDGSIQHVATVFKDVTAEAEVRAQEQVAVLAREELRKNDERLRLALVAGRLVTVETDYVTGRVSYSSNVADLTGTPADHIATLAEALSLVHPDDRQLVRDSIVRGQKQGVLEDLQYRIVRADTGETVWVERRLVVVTDDSGHVTGSRGLFIDITERKRAEEIRLRSAELELQNRRIQEASRLKSEFLANMSHELRTPLNAIIGFSELLFDGLVDPASPRHKEFLNDILISSRHLLQLINDVLDLSKVEAGKLDFHPEEFSLALVIREVIAILRTIAAEKQIRVELDLDDTLTRVSIDPGRLKQILYNFLSNALKFTPDGGRVVVRTRAESEHTFRLEVEDTGIGIAPSDIGRIFVEFQQLDTGATKRHAGTGLGLALTRRLVEAQGGNAGVRSTLGVGTVFHALLPRVAVERKRFTSAPAPGAVHPGASVILVVEDEPQDQQLLVQALSSAGYATVVARTGAEALELCRTRVFDGITLDLLLPDMSGLDLLPGIRSSGANRDVPVIVVTVADHKVISGFAVHDVLHKPLESGALLASLERAGVRPNKPGSILVVDDDHGSLRLMDATLAQLGYQGILRSSGQSGLEAVGRFAPSAIVLDLMMPEMDGFEFLDRLRKLEGQTRTPVIVWTLKDLTPAESLSLRQSVRTVISKNGRGPEALLAELRAFLPRPKPARVP